MSLSYSRCLAAVGLAAAALCLFAPPAPAGQVRLARHPDYHDGKIVFSYLGDLWRVNEDGSQPARLTTHKARDSHPHFSPDGKWIAFSSNRYGNDDVYVMPAAGGPATRLTYHSAGDTVVGWSRDSRRVLFSSARGHVFPGIPSLYDVPVTGGLEEPLPADWGYWGSYSPDGKKLAFNRHPAVWWRKHYRGSYSADLWVLDVENMKFKRILDDNLPDEMKPNNFWPMYGDGAIYFVSDREVMAKSGTPEVRKSRNNIWKIAEDGREPVQVTFHKSGSLFWPSMSSDGKVIVYEENFGLWKLDTATGKTAEVKIDIAADDADNTLESLTVSSECDSYGLSPTGKRAVISTRGEVFTIATDRGDVRRITSTPGARETQPTWSRDGKWIAFVSDRSGRDEVYVCDEEGGQLKKVSDGDSQKGQITWSPDSKSLLYTGSDRKLHRYDLDGGKTTVLATGEVIGFGGGAIQGAQWSPDGKWVSYSRADRTLLPHVYVIPSQGGAEKRITDEDVYSDAGAVWTADGKYLVYLSGIDIANIGQSGRSTSQIHAVALVRQEKDPGDRNIDSEAQAAAERPRGPGRFGGEPAEPGPVEVKIDFERIGRRARQLTRVADDITGLAVTPDGRTVVFVTSGTEGGRRVQSVWSIGLDGERLTRIVQAGMPTPEEEGPPTRGFGRFGGLSSLQFSKDGRSLFYRQGSGIYTVSMPRDLGTGTTGEGTATAPTSGRGGRGGGGAGARGGATRHGTPTAPHGSFTARVEIDRRAERRQVFNESWRVMKHRFYQADMHGADWEKVRATYEPLLDHCASQDDLHEVVSMMLGELNASHTGISGGGERGERGSAASTRHPGFELEADKSGYYRVKHVYKGGPADKDWVRISAGDYVLAIDGQAVKAGDNYWKHYTAAPGSKIEFTVNSKPAPEGAWKTKVAPVSSFQVNNLQYEKWVADRRAAVDKMSGGDIGYLHIRQMNETSLRQFERDLAVLHNKKALVIDQRFNPGGGIDQELLQILQQKQYQVTRVRDSVQVTRPLRGFFGPMVVMANERSTSDAEVFPDGFRTLKLGKVVGVTTYGAVIGTGSYQLMDGSSIRTPGSGLWNIDGTNLENNGVRPDVYVDNTPDDFLEGRDAQLEKAVEVLKAQIKR
jgi:tricorn protease